MINCSLNQILQLWSELEDCRNNKNSFGGDVAEIYAYKLREDSPFNNQMRINHPNGGTELEVYGEDIKRENEEVGKTLVSICRKFSKDRECNVHIMDGGYEAKNIFSDELQKLSFDHRIHVKVTPK